VVEQWREPASRERIDATPQLVVISARTREDLVAKLIELRGFVEARTWTPIELRALAASLQHGREPMAVRAAIVASSAQELANGLDVLARPSADLARVLGEQGATRRELVRLAGRWLAGERVSWPPAVDRLLSLPACPEPAQWWCGRHRVPADGSLAPPYWPGHENSQMPRPNDGRPPPCD
jgi:hypothetical protein